MKKVLKEFFFITVAFVIMLALVFKPYKSEVVDLDNFTEYYSDNASLEDGGGMELVKDNFYTIEREYPNKEEIEEKLAENEEDEEVQQELSENISNKKEETTKKEINKKEEKPKKEIKKKEIPKLETYIVKKGDTTAKIAAKYGMSEEILKINNPNLSSRLKAGQKIKVVKGNGIFYKVKKGDSLFKIALTYKVDASQLRKDNHLKGNNIKVGQELFISNPSKETLKRMEAKKKKNKKKTGKSYDGFIMPVSWTGITSPYGSRFHPVLKRYIFHAGVDLKARYVPLKASKDGVVIYVGYMTGYGKIIRIDHGNGYETRSAHLNKIYVRRGQKVNAGQVIGQTGMSGRVTGPHLHFEIRKNGRTLNPMRYLRR